MNMFCAVVWFNVVIIKELSLKDHSFIVQYPFGEENSVKGCGM